MLRLIRAVRPEVRELEAVVESLRSQLTADPYYGSLPPNVQARARGGELALYLTNSQISERAGIQPEYYKALYRYLSNYTHTYALSVSQLAAFRAGDPAALRLFTTSLAYGSAYLALGIRDFVRMVPDPPAVAPEVASLISKWEYLVAHTVGASEQAVEEAPSGPIRS